MTKGSREKFVSTEHKIIFKNNFPLPSPLHPKPFITMKRIFGGSFFKENLPIISIVFLAFLLRFYKLDFQSFWLDELHTARESAMSLKDLFYYLRTFDTHPPLFYLAEKCMILLFGSSEITLRFLPALAGTISVWAIYLLGKEFYNKHLGLTAALLTCVNFFHLSYSQEARQYIFLFLFVCLSFLFLVKFIKTLSLKNGLYYALFTLLALYFQYFSLFIVASQCVLAGLCWLWEQEDKRKFFLNFLISGCVIALGFSFQIPQILKMSSAGASWIPPTTDDFAIKIFFDFFGNAGLLHPFVILLLLLGLMYLLQHLKTTRQPLKSDRYALLALVLFGWICFSFLIAYLRSILAIPMIVSRYFIIVLPAFLLLLSLGFEFIKNRHLKYGLLIFFCLLSLIDITLVKNYYSKATKTQFRELAQSINDFPAYPVNAALTSWHLTYYLNKYGFKGPVYSSGFDRFSNDALHDTILHGFWLADAHSGPKPSKEVIDKLSIRYNLVQSVDFLDAWQILFLNKTDSGHLYTLYNFRNANKGIDPMVINADTVMPIWNDKPFTIATALPMGNYDIHIIAYGTAAKKIFPHLNISTGHEMIGQCFTTEKPTGYTFKYHPSKENSLLSIVMDNDYTDTVMKQDRNVFIKSILIIKRNH
jgi:uncharacterized membrane protein